MHRLTLAAFAALMLLATQPLRAQRPITFGLAGGLSLPQGDLSNASQLGWHALGTLNLQSPMLPMGLRLDAAYNRFAGDGDVSTSLGNFDVASLTGNFTYRLPMTNSPISPYVIGGMGAYRTSCSDAPDCGGSIDFGWNVGLGFKMYALGLRSFVEARYHRTERGTSDVHYFPLTLGLIF